MLYTRSGLRSRRRPHYRASAVTPRYNNTLAYCGRVIVSDRARTNQVRKRSRQLPEPDPLLPIPVKLSPRALKFLSKCRICRNSSTRSSVLEKHTFPYMFRTCTALDHRHLRQGGIDYHKRRCHPLRQEGVLTMRRVRPNRQYPVLASTSVSQKSVHLWRADS